MEPTQNHNDENDNGLPLVACYGGVAGLAWGIVLADLVSALLYTWSPEGRAAEVFWSIASPLLGISGVFLGSLGFGRYLNGRNTLSLILAFFMVVTGIWLVLGLVGFPWLVGEIGPDAV